MVNEKKILRHFQRYDPTLAAVYLKVYPLGPITPRQPQEYFLALTSDIIGQQLSSRVAEVIFDRFLNLFPLARVRPELLLKVPEQKLRDVGMAWSKVRYLKDLADKVQRGELDLASLGQVCDEELKKEITKVRGIGNWTAEMFLIFSLGRPDIFSVGDLGLKRAIQKIYHLKKEPTLKQLLKISNKWIPYRSTASRILWKSLDQVK